ncbi:corrin/porphyrin methyltransferase [Streptococcus criceti]|uniref:Ribosomal RNA small subunit methyltransferase I n=1 Tax=Streptococcus criceti HS-6 TaxID=873449 RepID=G5JSM5_STRCG|nr:16S rRNA (cytidine(1402)-2'-O)-methyltransferase [Streptococcus criceti]EHI74795.1 tetrapyrrole methylase family protein [Streptococcus criceti HS-6]SUN37505.1 corrin/porphyrin methyltransferase [Streptococcus criceti]
MQLQKSFKGDEETGKLYLVPTPIGNLQDMTYRSVEILKSVDFICAEDTRNTGLLLKHFEIVTKQISFHEHNAYEKIPDLLDLLSAGKNLAQVSDAGLPSISDPGHDLVQAAIEQGIPVVALPGASAGITALIASGLSPQPHIFYGFLPRKKRQQEEFFKQKLAYPETQIFYESPYRLVDTLTNMRSIYGDRQAVLVRELTKIYEEYQRGSISEILGHLAHTPAKGECLLIVSGSSGQEIQAAELDDSAITALVEEAIAQGAKPNKAIKEVAKAYQLNRQEVYKLYHDL